MKNLKNIFCCLALLFLFNSCRTLREIKNFAKCEFRVKDISTLNLGSTNMLNISSLSDFNFAEAGKLLSQYKANALPLNITYNLEVQNSHDKLAAMEKLDWILEIDNKDYLNGTTVDRVEVQPNGGKATLPISVSIDIKKIFEKESLDAMINLISGVTGDNQEQSRIRLKVKPRFIVAGLTLGYPGYIKVGKTFKGSEAVEK